MKNIIKYAVTFSLSAFPVVFLFSCNPDVKEKRKEPNLLFIFPDQFRSQAMGFMNEDPVVTPNLDQLAAEGMVFSNAVSNRPVCTPYRGMLMTGKYCFSNHLWTNCNTSSRKFGNYLHEDETCFSDVLNKGGYYCGYIGKWHLDAPSYEAGPDVDDWQNSIWEAYTPPGPKRHGFRFWHSYGCSNRHNDPYYWVNDDPVKDTLFPGKWSPEHEADVAIDFIRSNRNNPWALFVAMNPPHSPYDEVPEKYKAIYTNISADSLLNRPNVPKNERGDAGRKNAQDYFAAVTGVDDQIGRIMRSLEETGQAKNTIVVFTSDHGEMMGSHGRLGKTIWYEESFRIPFILKWPEKKLPGQTDLHLSAPDIMPTLLSLMGLKSEVPGDVEGKDYADIITGRSKQKPEFSLYLNCSYEDPKGGARGLRSDRYTFVIQKDKEEQTMQYLLYDRQADPYQLNNIADKNPDIIHDLEAKLMVELKRIKDPWVY